MNLLQLLNRIPPNACRLLARKANGRHGLSHREIAQASGLSLSMVSWISKRKTWNGIKIDTILSFSMACGVNHLQAERQLEYLRRRKMCHVDKATTNQRRFYLRLLGDI